VIAPALEVRLEDIPTCFEGVVPAAICTVDEEGVPNVTYLSVIHRVDSTHVALSRQFFNKTEHNTLVNPRAQLGVIEPATGRIFSLDLVYERTETEGPQFERMRTRLDAVAAAEGMANVFQLRGIDVCRVERCAMEPCDVPDEPERRDPELARVEECSRRLADGVADLDELFDTVLRTCSELLGHPHGFIMLLDEDGERLYTVASAGFDASGAGSEVIVGEGLIGVAAARRQSVRVTHLARERSYAHAAGGLTGGEGVDQPIPLPRLDSMQSILVSPMLAQHQLVGVLCLQSEAPGAFQSSDEWVVGILANQTAMALTALGVGDAGVEAAPDLPHPIRMKHYAEDDSVFLDDEYLIKGVAGAILWRLVQEHQRSGRIEFTNKELRLDPTLALPDIKDNLEARLILLRRRLEERSEDLGVEKIARGRFRLNVARPLVLQHVEAPGTTSPQGLP
jgi:adenylate cyclase